MRSWLAAHAVALRSVLGRLAGTPLATLLTIAVIGVTLSLPAGLYALVDNLARLSGNLKSQPELTLFLAPEAGRPDADSLRERLARHPEVRRAHFIPRDEALKDLQRNANLGDVMAGLQRNPLPDAFVVEARSSDTVTLERLRRELAGWPKVASAQVDSAWAKRFQALLGLGRQAAAVLAVLLGVALLAVTANTARLQILTLREEVEVSKLIGATDRFVRRPFLYYGALQGLLGGLTAWAVVALGLHALDVRVAELAALYASDFRLQMLAPGATAAMLALAAGLGWIGAYIAVSRHLRHIDDRSA